ncbi:MAG TPA: hypothetical protein VGG83_27425 [Trebonia sp.]|jgi:hypothetical protein
MAEMRGNPLVLIELPYGLRPDELAGGFGVLKTGTGMLASSLEERIPPSERGSHHSVAQRQQHPEMFRHCLARHH